MHDVPLFDRLAPLYDPVMPSADVDAVRAGFANATRDVARVLDLAGGTGRVARELDEEAVVLDASREMLRRAHARGLPAVLGDARFLPIRDGAVDAIVVAEALHHLPDHDRVFRECARVLRPGGVLVVRDVDPTALRGRLFVAAERAFGFDSRFYAPDDLAARLDSAGFDAAVPEPGFTYTVTGRLAGAEP
ncbi:class I SAM-dependent methyltransferase [Halocalculus aciditolerans]|uniref:Methyltransferase type 11 domain-containing protein n=1 Tax=Halocalculus aciditolerans TaxID=1383812 RepID=A0A830F2K6_9EURY|nr:class I SAM-dependent methyltransferase [Halocalculus aciditolerans]GGL56502.1 hypothetical protein GCM10009039_13280 [Halocalculus aciditolerans]